MKPIKFNLRYGNMQIRDLDELKDNCNIDMLLEKFQSGELERWIIPQNKPDILEKIRTLSKNDNIIKTASQLCSILLGMEITEAQKVAVSVYGEQKRNEKQDKKLSELSKKEIITECFKVFNKTLGDMKKNLNDYDYLSRGFLYLKTEYEETFESINKIRNSFIYSNSVMLLTGIVNENTRTFVQQFINKHRLKEICIDVYKRRQTYRNMPFKIYEVRHAQWQQIAPEGTQCMVIYVNDVRIVGRETKLSDSQGHIYGPDDLNGVFKVFNGLQIFSNYGNSFVIYLEIKNEANKI